MRGLSSGRGIPVSPLTRRALRGDLSPQAGRSAVASNPTLNNEPGITNCRAKIIRHYSEHSAKAQLMEWGRPQL